MITIGNDSAVLIQFYLHCTGNLLVHALTASLIFVMTTLNHALINLYHDVVPLAQLPAHSISV